MSHFPTTPGKLNFTIYVISNSLWINGVRINLGTNTAGRNILEKPWRWGQSRRIVCTWTWESKQRTGFYQVVRLWASTVLSTTSCLRMNQWTRWLWRGPCFHGAYSPVGGYWSGPRKKATGLSKGLWEFIMVYWVKSRMEGPGRTRGACCTHHGEELTPRLGWKRPEEWCYQPRDRAEPQRSRACGCRDSQPDGSTTTEQRG